METEPSISHNRMMGRESTGTILAATPKHRMTTALDRSRSTSSICAGPAPAKEPPRRSSPRVRGADGFHRSGRRLRCDGRHKRGGKNLVVKAYAKHAADTPPGAATEGKGQVNEPISCWRCRTTRLGGLGPGFDVGQRRADAESGACGDRDGVRCPCGREGFRRVWAVPLLSAWLGVGTPVLWLSQAFRLAPLGLASLVIPLSLSAAA